MGQDFEASLLSMQETQILPALRVCDLLLCGKVCSSGESLGCNLHSGVSVAICAAVLVCVSGDLYDVCSAPMWLVLHSSFSHPKADVTRTMGSSRLPWRPTGGRLKVSPPCGAQQMEAQVIICCSVHLLSPLLLQTHTGLYWYCCHYIKDVKWFSFCKHIKQLKLFALLSIKTHYPHCLHGCDKFYLVYKGQAK